MGRFMAHTLRGMPNPPPVTLIFQNWQAFNAWKESPQRIQVVVDGSTEKQEGFDAELALPHRRYRDKKVPFEGKNTEIVSETEQSIREGESTEPISSLIVCTDTPVIRQALSSVKHRLRKDSVILFLQNGMGWVDEINREIFPDPEARPHYMIGVNTHGLLNHPNDPYTTTHVKHGTLSLGLLPPERDRESAPYSPSSSFSPGDSSPADSKYPANPYPDAPPPKPETFTWTPSDRYLLRTLLRTPVLCATAFSPSNLLQLQLEKLAINSVISPLTVMLDARNGSILYNYALTRTMRLLLSEISLVIRSLPELQYIPNVSQRFDPSRLETIIVSTAHQTRDNISSMLQDVRRGRQTDIEYLNGWIVKKGEEQGVRCLMNYMMMNLVKGKGSMIQWEIGEDVPFIEEKTGEGSVEIKSEAKIDGEST